MTATLGISQLRAIKRAARLGRTLQTDFPEIAQDYREGLSKPKIVKKYSLKEKYGVGENIAQNAIAFALRGHGNNLGVKAYQGLIPDRAELARLGLEHQVDAMANALTKEERKKNGENLYNQRLGIHALTHKERIINSTAGGKASRDSKSGFHAFTHKQKLEQQRDAMIASGKTPWTTKEKNRTLKLTKHPDYQSGKRGPCYRKIADQINLEFHNNQGIRTRGSINYLLFRIS